MGSTNNWLGFSPFSGAQADAGAALHPPHEGKAGWHDDDEEPPKLEDFLGMQESAAADAGRSTSISSGVGASSIGLSMIKSWLRSQPAPVVGGDAMALTMSSPAEAEGAGAGTSTPDGRGKVADGAAVDAAARKAVDTFGQRTSIYRGVTKHRWTGRYEAHLWDNSCRREGQTRKGRQVYLGGYDKEDKAARAYDLAALKYWGATTTTNFPVSDYEKELEEMKHMTRQEYVASLRRKSSGFSRGASIYRGVTRHHQHGRWQARIGRVAGNKDLYLGTFSTQEEAAEAYDIAAIKFRGLNAVTNFDMSRYDVQSIIESSSLPISGTTKRLKDGSDQTDIGMDGVDAGNVSTSKLINSIGSYASHHYGYTGWSPVSLQAIPLQYDHGQQSRTWCKEEQDTAVVAAAQNLRSLHHFAPVDNTQNFFQQSSVPDVMGIGSLPSQSVDSSSLMYNGGLGYHGARDGGSYGMPIASAVEQGQGNQVTSGHGDCGLVGGGTMPDLYGGRNVYYLSQDLPGADVRKDDSYEQGSGCNGWVWPAPVTAQKVDTTVCHGVPLFSLWNDA